MGRHSSPLAPSTPREVLRHWRREQTRKDPADDHLDHRRDLPSWTASLHADLFSNGLAVAATDFTVSELFEAGVAASGFGSAAATRVPNASASFAILLLSSLSVLTRTGAPFLSTTGLPSLSLRGVVSASMPKCL